MRITAQQIAEAVQCRADVARKWEVAINETLAAFDINTPKRVAAFLAQIGHESARLRYVRELWGPTPAQSRYEGRKDLGNTEPGDGFRFRGRGLIQVTGRDNYRRMRDALRALLGKNVPDFIDKPEALEQTRWAALSAGMYWQQRGLNAQADADDFVGLTRKINGGTNGLDDRKELWASAKTALATA